jgi:hypothetical protein
MANERVSTRVRFGRSGQPKCPCLIINKQFPITEPFFEVPGLDQTGGRPIWRVWDSSISLLSPEAYDVMTFPYRVMMSSKPSPM